LLLILCTIGATTLPQRAANKLKSTMGESKFSYLSYTVLALVLLASVAFLVADSYNPFLYFRF
jgi:alginate O-acetyltransferase complex protein AlgI